MEPFLLFFFTKVSFFKITFLFFHFRPSICFLIRISQPNSPFILSSSKIPFTQFILHTFFLLPNLPVSQLNRPSQLNHPVLIPQKMSSQFTEFKSQAKSLISLKFAWPLSLHRYAQSFHFKFSSYPKTFLTSLRCILLRNVFHNILVF